MLEIWQGESQLLLLGESPCLVIAFCMLWGFIELFVNHVQASLAASRNRFLAHHMYPRIISCLDCFAAWVNGEISYAQHACQLGAAESLSGPPNVVSDTL